MKQNNTAIKRTQVNRQALSKALYRKPFCVWYAVTPWSKLFGRYSIAI
ncbi:hypothetical protein [Sphingobacterium sp. SGG-5]|nr:hypothetical protein [Sphingobacterium sp. SGG-5]